MKKFITLMMCVLMIMMVAGCGGEVQNPDVTVSGGTENTTDATQTTTNATDETTVPNNTNGTENTVSNVTDPTENTKPNTGSGNSNNQSETKPDSTNPTKPDVPPTTTPSEGNTKPTNCSHKNTSLINVVVASCKQDGYSGDTYCNNCKKVITYGKPVANTTGHKTEIRNAKEATTTSSGYTGDEVCTVCGKTIVSGSVIPQLNVTTPTTPAETVDYFRSSLKENKWSVSRRYKAAEEEFLRLCNEERAKVGAPPLKWLSDAYCYATIRADEMYKKFSHTRPNGKSFSTVYSDNGVVLHNSGIAENLHFYNSKCDYADDATRYAAMLFDTWMREPNHKALILNPEKNYTTIVIEKDTILCVQHFFSLD